MADDKKKAPEGKSGGLTPFEELVYFFGGLFILAVIIGQISFYFNSIGWGNISTVWSYFLHSYVFPLWHNWKYISVLISAASVIWFMHSYRKVARIDEEETAVFGPPAPLHPIMDEVAPPEKNEKWERVIAHIHSDNPSDWRLAIMEADIILEETLRRNGFPGETIGDMLKSAQPGDFRTLDAAWEAHKVRNKVAHSGSDFDLNAREALRVVNLFEAVFREFKII